MLCLRSAFSYCLLQLVSCSSRSLHFFRSSSTKVLPTSFPFVVNQLSSVATFLSGHQLRSLLTHPQRFELAFVDSGTSKMITPFRADFITYDLLSPQQRESIDGFTSGQTTYSVGKGIVRYEVFDSTGPYGSLKFLQSMYRMLLLVFLVLSGLVSMIQDAHKHFLVSRIRFSFPSIVFLFPFRLILVVFYLCSVFASHP